MAQAIHDLPDETEREIEAFVDDWLVDDGVPGAAVAVVDGDETVYAEGFGARDLASNAPATASTLFGIGSATKSFTALSVCQLAEDGDLALDDPVTDHVDFLADAPGDPITVRELLTHTSGMPSDDSATALLVRRILGAGVEVPVSSRADFRRHVDGAADRRVTDHERFQYYNSGYTVLGRIVEAVSGRPYAEYVRQSILDPLGMTRSTFDREAHADDEDAATAYRRDDDGLEPVAFPFDEHVHPAGGLVAPVTELATYLAMQANGGSHGGADLLDAARTAEMHDAHATRMERLDGTEQGYGYGWMTEPLLGDTLVGHGGSVAVSTAWIGFLEDAGLGVAVACNAAPESHPMHVGPALLAILRGEEPADHVPYYALREQREAVTGEYEGYREIIAATVEREAGGLRLRQKSPVGEEVLPLFPTSLDRDGREFYAVLSSGARLPVEFRETEDGMDVFVERSRFSRVGPPAETDAE